MKSYSLQKKEEKLLDPSKRSRYNFLNREIRRKTKECRDKWLKGLCTKVDKAHQAAKSKEVYSTIKQITRKATIKMQTVKSKEGEILTETNDVKNRWKQNYEDLYNNQNPVNKELTNTVPQMGSNTAEPEILLEEVISAKTFRR